MIVKLVKLRDNTSRQLSTLELLMNTVFGDGVPNKFVPGNEYDVGDIVYIQNSKGEIVIKECIIPGVYYDVDNSGWKDFEIPVADEANPADNKLFSPGSYVAGDRQVVIGDSGEITVYECIKDGYYTEITDDGWRIVPFADDTPDDNKALLDSIITLETEQYIQGETYESGDIIYVVDNSTGSVTLYENTGSDPTSELPPTFPWSKLDASQYIIDGVLKFATDEDIMAMFGVDKMPDCEHDNTLLPDLPDNDNDVEWEEF